MALGGRANLHVSSQRVAGRAGRGAGWRRVRPTRHFRCGAEGERGRAALGLDSATAKIRYQKEYKDLTVVRYITYEYYNLCVVYRGILKHGVPIHKGLGSLVVRLKGSSLAFLMDGVSYTLFVCS